MVLTINIISHLLATDRPGQPVAITARLQPTGPVTLSSSINRQSEFLPHRKENLYPVHVLFTSTLCDGENRGRNAWFIERRQKGTSLNGEHTKKETSHPRNFNCNDYYRSSHQNSHETPKLNTPQERSIIMEKKNPDSVNKWRLRLS